MNAQGILFENQFGFRNNTTLNDNLFNLIKNFNSFIGGKKYYLCLFDLAKASNTMDRSILIIELHYIGIKGLELDWFASNLSNRQQIVSSDSQIID